MPVSRGIFLKNDIMKIREYMEECENDEPIKNNCLTER